MQARYHLLLILVAVFGTVGTAQQATIDQALSDQLATGATVDALVVFSEFPDLSAAQYLESKEEKGRFVFEALRQNSARHQATTALLDASQISYRDYWVGGAIMVYDADRALLNALASQPLVKRLAALPTWQLNLPADVPSVAALQSRSAQAEWGLRYMNVPAVWDLGVRGEGAVIGGQDTGYDWNHPALKKKYRGYIDTDSADHAYNWHDAIHERSPLNDDDNNPCGFDVRFPCDDGSHGTHTMGTMVGSDGANEIGVAPDAEWIGCRSMERGWGRPESYLECVQWFVAPTDLDGNNPRPDLAPDVIANSWYCPELEGCDSTTYPAFDNVVAALRAAGVVVVVSAGNDGRSGCGTVNRIPAQSPGVIAVAAHDSLGQIASFSSRGNFAEPLNGPDIAAPGVAVRSSVPTDQYRFFNGTSMAGPHVAGLVALMVSARPELRGQVDTLEALLYRSATAAAVSASDTCSIADGPNMTFGEGYANALAAVQAAQAWGGISGTRNVPSLKAQVAPNPVERGFTLLLPEAAVGGTLTVYDALGRSVLRQQVMSPRTDILTQQWTRGTYVYEVRSAAGVASGRIVRR